MKFEHKKDVEALIGQFSELKTLKTGLSAFPADDTFGTKICSKDVDQKSSKVVEQKLSKNVVRNSVNFVDQKSSKDVERDNLQTVEQQSSKVVEQKSSKVVDEFSFRPIGVVRSCHSTKNGIPRQATVAPGTRGLIDISEMSDKFNNPEYSLQNLDEFSHIWGRCYKTFLSVIYEFLYEALVSVLENGAGRPSGLGQGKSTALLSANVNVLSISAA